MWTNSKLNSFTRSFTSSSSPSNKLTSGDSFRKKANSSIAKAISNNFSSLSNYSLSLAGNSNDSANNSAKSSSINDAGNYRVKNQSQNLNNINEEAISNSSNYKYKCVNVILCENLCIFVTFNCFM